MLTALKQQKLLNSLKAYRKDFLDGNIKELDESGTRIMINRFLSDVLGYKQLEEIKTEYMIKGTYADYVIQVNKNRHFIVKLKVHSIQLLEKRLKQSINYITSINNGRRFKFYNLLLKKLVSSQLLFTVSLNNAWLLRPNKVAMIKFWERRSQRKLYALNTWIIYYTN